MNKITTPLITFALLLPLPVVQAGERVCEEDAAACARQMAEHFKQKGWVGISMDYDESSGRVIITKVFPTSPAEKAGFQPGDVLTSLNGIDYTKENEQALKQAYKSFRPDASVTYGVERDGEPLDIEVYLAEIPEHILAQWVGRHMLEQHQAEIEESSDEEEADQHASGSEG